MQSSTSSNEKTSLPVRPVRRASATHTIDAPDTIAPGAPKPLPVTKAPFVPYEPYEPYIPSATPKNPKEEAPAQKETGPYASITVRELVLAVLFLGGVIALYLSPAIFTGRYLSPADLLLQNHPWVAQPPQGWGGVTNLILSDVVTAFDPWRQFAAERLASGHLPLWNPDNMLGAPFIGNAQTAVFYPGNWLYYLWPSGYAYALMVGVKLLLAGLGTYLFARQVMRIVPFGAIVAALSYCFASYMIVWLLYGLSDAALWLPWLWWATGRLIASLSPLRIAVLALIVALSLFSGHFETSYHAAVATGLFALFEIFRASPLQFKPISRAFLGWAFAYGIGAGVAAVQILPFIEYLDNSVIKLVRLNAAGPESVPWFYAWTMFSPKLFGSHVSPSTWWGPFSNYNESNAYFGVLSLVLAPFAVLSGGRKRRWLALALLVIIAFSMGVVYHWPVIYDLASRLPFMGATRGQRMVFVVQFAFASLAALGADGLWQTAKKHWWRIVLCLLVTAPLLLLAGIAFPWLNASNPFPVPLGHEGVLKTWQDGLSRGGWLVLVYGVTILGAASLWRWRRKTARAVLVLLPLLLGFDLITSVIGYNPTLPPGQYYPPTPEIDYLKSIQKPSRFIALSWIIPPNTNLMYGISDFRGYDVMMPLSYRELGQQIDGQVDVPEPRALNNIHSPIINYLNVQHVLIPPGDPSSTSIKDVEQTVLDQGAAGVVGSISGSTRPGQTFQAGRNNLSQVRVYGGTYLRQNTGQLIFHLKDSPEATTDLATIQVDVSQLRDNSYWDFNFPPIADSKGRSFYFYLESPDSPENQAVTVYFSANDLYAGGTRMMDGKPVEGDLAFATVALLSPDEPWLRPVQGFGGGNRMAVLENRRALPRAWMVHAAEVQPDKSARLNRLRDTNFNPATTVVLNAPLPSDQVLPPSPPTQGSDSVTIDSYEPEKVQISTDSPSAGLLVLADQDFPGWKAYLDDREVPIYTANHALRAVYVPAGSHKVRFEYQPLSFTVGAGISGVSLLVVVLLPLLSRLRRRDAEA